MIICSTHKEPCVVTFRFEVHFTTLTSGSITDSQFMTLLKTLCPGSTYTICPGLPQDVLSQLPMGISTGFPFNQVDHRACKLWFPGNMNPLMQREPTCDNCTQLLYYANKKVKKQHSISHEIKEKHSQPSSNFPLKLLTPLSRKRRENRKRKEKLSVKKQLKKFRYKHYDIDVDDTTNAELRTLVAQIQDKSKADLEALLAEADSKGKGDILRKAWCKDIQDQQAFHRDQRRNGQIRTRYMHTMC